MAIGMGGTIGGGLGICIEKDLIQRTHRVQARTRAVYATLDQLPAATRNSQYFDATLEHQLTQPTRSLETWLAYTEPLVHQGLVEIAQTLATGHLDIRDYFRPITPTLPPD